MKFRKPLLTRLLSLVLLALMLSSFCCATVQSSDYLDAYSVEATAGSGGLIYISVDVDAIGDMTMLGVTDLYLYESTDGVHFTMVKHYNYLDYPVMMGSGWHHCKDIDTYEGIIGRYYYVLGYIYAANSSGSDTRTYSSVTVRGKIF